LLFVRIHGCEIFGETPSYTGQYFTKVIMDGMEIFDEKTSCNNKLLIKKLKTSR
jgi:hypothetical protein